MKLVQALKNIDKALSQGQERGNPHAEFLRKRIHRIKDEKSFQEYLQEAMKKNGES